MLGPSLPLFSAIPFYVTCQRQNHPRMTSTVLRWAVKHHPFPSDPNPDTPNNPTNGSKVRRGSIFFVCLTSPPAKKILKMAPQFVFGRCKHLLRAEIWHETRSSLTLMRSSRTPEICSSAFHCSSRRIRRLHNGVPSPSIGNMPQTASTYQGQPLQST